MHVCVLKGKCIDFSSRAQMKNNWISVPMVYLSLAYGKGNLPYRRFPDPVSMATTGDDAHSALLREREGRSLQNCVIFSCLLVFTK